MRLSAHQQATVRATVEETFGSDAQVRLFGSRVDDTKRGGDIDLLVSTTHSDVPTLMRAEIALLTKLQMKLGEQKIDVLIDYPQHKQQLPIYLAARQQGVVL